MLRAQVHSVHLNSRSHCTYHRPAFLSQPDVQRCHSAATAAPAATGVDPKKQAAVYDAVERLLAAADEVNRSLGIDLTGQSRRVEHTKVANELAAVEAAGKEAGVNVVRPEWNEGSFRGELSTDLRAISADSQTTLGRALFSNFNPVDLLVRLGTSTDTELIGQYKGPFEGNPQTYLVEAQLELLDGSNLAALQRSLGSWALDPENSQRLTITFEKLRLQLMPQLADQPEVVERWLALMQKDNPTMDSAGVATVELSPAPKGWLDYLVMLPDLHVTKGNFGSVNVLKRRSGVPRP